MTFAKRPAAAAGTRFVGGDRVEHEHLRRVPSRGRRSIRYIERGHSDFHKAIAGVSRCFVGGLPRAGHG